MSTAHIFQGAMAPMLGGKTFLGGGRVLALAGDHATVSLGDGHEVSAKLALAFSYVPQLGDELLIIGKAGEHFVIGVLQGSGDTRLEFPGDVALRAGKNIQLEADEGISLSSDKLEIGAETMRIVADTVVESAREMVQRIRDLWSIRAGQKNEQIAGEWSHRSEKASITTADDVSVNGREIRLG